MADDSIFPGLNCTWVIGNCMEESQTKFHDEKTLILKLGLLQSLNPVLLPTKLTHIRVIQKIAQ